MTDLAMTDFGTDLSVTEGGFELISGLDNLAGALARRLQTPRGGLFYDATYGHDLRRYLHGGDTDELRFELTAGIEAEVEKDPRVMSCSASVLELARDTLRLELLVETRLGPFRLVARASPELVEVLHENT